MENFIINYWNCVNPIITPIYSNNNIFYAILIYIQYDTHKNHYYYKHGQLSSVKFFIFGGFFQPKNFDMLNELLNYN